MGALVEKLRGTDNRFRMGATSFLTAVFNTVALLIIARQMGAETLGTLGFLLAFVGLFFFVGDMGHALAFERSLAKGHRFSECYKVFITAKLKLTVAMVVLAGMMVALYVLVLEPATGTDLHPVSMAIMLGYFVVMNLAGIWIVGLNLRRGGERPNTFELIDSLAKALMIIGVIWVADIFVDDVFQLVLIYLLAGTLAMMLARNSARRLKAGEYNEEVEVDFQDEAVKVAPFIAMGAVILCLDKIILWYFTDFQTLGVYFGAQRVTVFIGAAAVSIQILLGRVLSDYIRDNDTERLSETLRLTERYVCLVVLPVSLFYIALSGDLMTAFLGQDFFVTNAHTGESIISDAGITVALLAGTGFFTAMASPHISYLLKADRTRALTFMAGLSLAVFAILAALLMPNIVLAEGDFHPMNRMAAALLASAAVGYAVARYHTWKILGCGPHPRMLAHLLSGALMMAFVHFVIWYFDITLNFGWLLVMAAVGTIVYTLALYLTGEMLKTDFDRFRELTTHRD
jgi:O-antigen/teichoic acid export membrane protein